MGLRRAIYALRDRMRRELLLQFAVISLIVMVIIGLGLGAKLGQIVEQTALTYAGDEANFVLNDQIIAEAQRSLYAALAIGLIFLYATLFMVVKMASDLITRQRGRLFAMREKVRHLSKVQEQSSTLQQQNEHLAVLNRAATELSHCLTLAEGLSTGLNLALEATGLPTAAIWLLGSDDRVELAADRGFVVEDEAILADLTSRNPLLHEVLSSDETRILDRSALWSALQPLEPDGRTIASAMLVPLLSRGRAVGVLGLFNNVDEPYGQSAVQIAQAIGAGLGVTLENAKFYEEALTLADRDPLTGLLNHRAFHQRLEEEIKRAQRAGRELAVIMMDLDDFKFYNDTYGHPAGDHVLKEIARLLAREARAGDVVGRYGGDELVALIVNAGQEQAIAVAERFRTTLEAKSIITADGSEAPIRMSFGIASYPQDARHGNELMYFADTNLYASKRRGGNMITSGQTPFGDEHEDTATGNRFEALDGLVTAVDNKDRYTRKHSEDVTTYALSIAQALGLPEENLETLRIAGQLHDVGKIGVPDRILRKPGPLDKEEFAIISQHACLGEMIIKDVPNIGSVLEAVGAHHERFDGTGYPRSMKGERIPLLGRILAVADAYSAMTSDRPYRKALSPEAARKELLRAAGTQFDPQLVEVFLNLIDSGRPIEGMSFFARRAR